MTRWLTKIFQLLQRNSQPDDASGHESDDERTVSVRDLSNAMLNQEAAINSNKQKTKLSWPAREQENNSFERIPFDASKTEEWDDEAPTRLVKPADIPVDNNGSLELPRGEEIEANSEIDDEKTRIVRNSNVDDPVTGWLVIIEGPGKGRSLEIGIGVNQIGRALNQKLRLDFGDPRISRERHAILTFEPNAKKFFLQNGESRNLTYIGKKPVLEPTQLKTGEVITIGDTKLRFVAFCGSNFSWT